MYEKTQQPSEKSEKYWPGKEEGNPEGYAGIDLNIDAMSPIFHEDGTVDLISGGVAADLVREGAIIRLGSNSDQGKDAFAKVLKFDKTTRVIKVKLFD